MTTTTEQLDDFVSPQAFEPPPIGQYPARIDIARPFMGTDFKGNPAKKLRWCFNLGAIEDDLETPRNYYLWKETSFATGEKSDLGGKFRKGLESLGVDLSVGFRAGDLEGEFVDVVLMHNDSGNAVCGGLKPAGKRRPEILPNPNPPTSPPWAKDGGDSPDDPSEDEIPF